MSCCVSDSCLGPQARAASDALGVPATTRWVAAMSVTTEDFYEALLNKPRRRVSLRRDDEDFVVVFEPDNVIALRNRDAAALRRMCSFLRWEIISDASRSANVENNSGV